MDICGPATRSYTMSRIRKTDTKPEMRLRRSLWAAGLRGWRVRRKLPGTPDIVFGRARLVIFVHGCFWHGCPKCAIRKPRSNRSYWIPKLKRNKARDKRVTKELRVSGWSVMHVWEHEVMRDADRVARRVVRRLGVARARNRMRG